LVVGLEERDKPLADAFVGSILKLDVELDVLLDIESFIPLPLTPNLPLRLAGEEVKHTSFSPSDYDGEQLPVLGIAGFPDRLIIEERVQFVLDVLDWHLLRLYADFAGATYHSAIMLTKTVAKIKRRWIDMPAIVRLSTQEIDAMIANIEAGGGDAEELKKHRAEVANHKWLAKHEKPLGEEDYLAEKRAQSKIEYGTDLECMICHDKFDHLISGTCEDCFRKWVLTIKRR